VSWAWARDKFGSPSWIDLSYEVGSWTDARGIESGNTTCPENTTWIGSAEACQRAARAMGKAWGASENTTEVPSGCFGWKGGSYVYFNEHPVGSDQPRARPLCAVGTAPLTFARAVPCAIAQRTGCTGTAGHRQPRHCGVHPEPLHLCRADPPILMRVTRAASHARRTRARLHDQAPPVWYPRTLP
jgi:hypothetical protein